MTLDARRFRMLLPLCMAWLVASASGQSLSVARKGERQFSVEAIAPASAPFVLQASANLHLWVDANDGPVSRLSYPFATDWVPRRYFRLVSPADAAPSINLVLIGDSTVADLAANSGIWSGWGQGAHGYFKPNARVVNLAWPGLSSRWFLASEQKKQMQAIKPEYVLVQFGAVDDLLAPDDPMTVPLSEYRDNLRTIVQTIRGFEGTPILVTPPVWRNFDASGKIELPPGLEARCDVVREVAADLEVEFVDLHLLTLELFNRMGDSASRFIQAGNNAVHYSEQGATIVAQLVVNALPDRLGPYLTGIFDTPPHPSN